MSDDPKKNALHNKCVKSTCNARRMVGRVGLEPTTKGL
jgi:hypothetical protein